MKKGLLVGIIVIVVLIVIVAGFFIIKPHKLNKKTECVPEGHAIMGPFGVFNTTCCEGLREIYTDEIYDSGKCVLDVNVGHTGEEGGICSRCGDGICNPQTAETYCSCPKDCSLKNSSWLNDTIKHETNLKRVEECGYNNQTVYYFIHGCCDFFDDIYDSSGNKICGSGGFSGRGYGNCTGFNESSCKVYWLNQEQLCTYDEDCPKNYSCYNSKTCPKSPNGNICGPQEGDLRCHANCEKDSDCISPEKCINIKMARGDTNQNKNICITENMTQINKDIFNFTSLEDCKTACVKERGFEYGQCDNDEEMARVSGTNLGLCTFPGAIRCNIPGRCRCYCYGNVSSIK